MESFSLLTMNADGHPIMGRFHRPGDERRSLVVMSRANWDDWLNATPTTASQLLFEIPKSEYTAKPVGLPKAQVRLL